MENKIKSIIYFLTAIIAFISGCKNNDNVQNPETPTGQNSNAPLLVSPTNGSVITGLSPTLDWKDFSNAVSYRVQASLDGNINGTMLLDTTVTASTLTFPANKTKTGVNIYWRVIAKLPGNTYSDWSAIWKYISRLNPPPAPVLVSPVNGSNNIPFIPYFDWNDAPTADFYRIQVSTSPSFNSTEIDQNNISVSQYQSEPGNLITGTQYYWRVNASNTNGLSISNWSQTFNFTTVTGPIPMSVSGRVTFADTNFVALPAYYIVGLYSFWPPVFSFPDRFIQILVQHQGNTYFADYVINNVANASYRVVVSLLDPSEIKTLGIYGCDTAHVEFSTCPVNPDSVVIQNYNGVDNINFLSWADSTKKIY